jgi:hypothetical protein
MGGFTKYSELYVEKPRIAKKKKKGSASIVNLPETKLEIFTIQNWKKGLMSTLCSF